MEKNKPALWGRLAYIGGICVLLLIGVLILFGDKIQTHTPIVKRTSIDSAAPTAASKISTRLSLESEVQSDELPSGDESRPNAPFEAVGTATDMPSEAIPLSDIPSPSQDHIVQDNAANPEKEEDDPYILLEHQDVHEFMENLAIEISEKYPDIIELASMPPEDILKKYPTEAAIHALEERYLQFESEFMEDIRDGTKVLLLTEHVEDVVDVLLEMEKILRENWGDEIAKEIMEGMQTRLDLQ